MHKGRLEAFSDGVIAIIITIMVLELKAPHSPEPSSLLPLLPDFLSYLLSFIYIGIYWNNHHHLMQATRKVSGAILWANLHLLFWLSLVPFTTAWMGINHFSSGPILLYGLNLLLAAIAYTILTRVLVAHHGEDSLLAKAIGNDLKGNASLGLYLLAIVLAPFFSWVSFACYVIVAIIWLAPDRRIECIIEDEKKS